MWPKQNQKYFNDLIDVINVTRDNLNHEKLSKDKKLEVLNVLNDSLIELRLLVNELIIDNSPNKNLSGLFFAVQANSGTHTPTPTASPSPTQQDASTSSTTSNVTSQSSSSVTTEHAITIQTIKP